jgi:biotin carboxylase
MRSNSTFADITNLHVFDGEVRIASHDNLDLSPSAWTMLRFAVPNRPEVKWGVGVPLGVRFTGTTDDANTMEISAAGCDFWP